MKLPLKAHSDVDEEAHQPQSEGALPAPGLSLAHHGHLVLLVQTFSTRFGLVCVELASKLMPVDRS